MFNPVLKAGHLSVLFLRMRTEGYCSWVCLSVCVCLFNISPLEHLENHVTYSTGNEGQNTCVFVRISLNLLYCRDPACMAILHRPFSLCGKTHMHYSTRDLQLSGPHLLTGGKALRIALQRAEGLHFSAFQFCLCFMGVV